MKRKKVEKNFQSRMATCGCYMDDKDVYQKGKQEKNTPSKPMEKPGEKSSEKPGDKSKAKKSDCGCYMTDPSNAKKIQTIPFYQQLQQQQQKEKFTPPTLDRWRQIDIKNYVLGNLIPRLGRPSISLNLPGGSIVWKRSAFVPCATRIVVRDHPLLHTEPKPHHDCISVVIPFIVPPQYFQKVMTLFSTLLIDQIEKTLTCRCGSLEICIATLDIVVRSITSNTIQLLSQFGDWLVNSRNPAQLTRMINDLCTRLLQWNTDNTDNNDNNDEE